MRSRFAAFVAIILAILILAHGFVWFTWIHFQGGLCGLAWQSALAALTLVFVPATMASMRHSSLPLRLVYRASALWLGMLSFLFFAALACWIIAGAAAIARFNLNGPQVVGVIYGGAVLAGFAATINASLIRFTRATVRLRDLPEAWQGRSAALVTDLHLGNVRGRAFVASIVRRIQSLDVDVVFISGDHFDGTQADFSQMTSPWSALSATRKIFFVTGNHEEFHDRSAFVGAIKSAGIHVLENEKAVMDGLQIVGVNDQDARDPESLRNILERAQLDPARAAILLAHQPQHFPVVENAGVSLQLSGHTHGGQLWPWTRVAHRVHGVFNRGLNRHGGLQVFTSCGVGTWGPPMRLGTRSEIVLLRFENETAGADQDQP